MAIAFDTLGYSKRLRDAGLVAKQAEAHAEAARDFIMAELVTKGDLNAAVAAIDAKFHAMEAKLETQTLRLGGIVVAAMGALTVIQRFL